MIAVGIMSGTSLDGIEIAAVEIEPGPNASARLLASDSYGYPGGARERVLRAASGADVGAFEIARLHVILGEAYADAARDFIAKLGRKPDVIAVHGQTIAHLPDEGVTFQIGDATRVAQATGVPTVDDFRSADVAAGGQGAPMVPFGDLLLFGSHAPVAMLNLGGIANLTLIPTTDADQVIAFDTGPGNMVSDTLAARSGQTFDRDGRVARRGRPREAAMREALAHPFFAKRAPKSTGREDFGAPFATAVLDTVRAEGGTLEDSIATAVEITARSVADALRRETPGGVTWRALVAAGGGTRNDVLMEALARAVAPIPVKRSDAFGVPPSAREAAAFAILGAYRLRGLPNTLPRTTGARRAVCAGALHLP